MYLLLASLGSGEASVALSVDWAAPEESLDPRGNGEASGGGDRLVLISGAMSIEEALESVVLVALPPVAMPTFASLSSLSVFTLALPTALALEGDRAATDLGPSGIAILVKAALSGVWCLGSGLSGNGLVRVADFSVDAVFLDTGLSGVAAVDKGLSGVATLSTGLSGVVALGTVRSGVTLLDEALPGVVASGVAAAASSLPPEFRAPPLAPALLCSSKLAAIAMASCSSSDMPRITISAVS